MSTVYGLVRDLVQPLAGSLTGDSGSAPPPAYAKYFDADYTTGALTDRSQSAASTFTRASQSWTVDNGVVSKEGSINTPLFSLSGLSMGSGATHDILNNRSHTSWAGSGSMVITGGVTGSDGTSNGVKLAPSASSEYAEIAVNTPNSNAFDSYAFCLIRSESGSANVSLEVYANGTGQGATTITVGDSYTYVWAATASEATPMVLRVTSNDGNSVFVDFPTYVDDSSWFPGFPAEVAGSKVVVSRDNLSYALGGMPSNDYYIEMIITVPWMPIGSGSTSKALFGLDTENHRLLLNRRGGGLLRYDFEYRDSSGNNTSLQVPQADFGPGETSIKIRVERSSTLGTTVSLPDLGVSRNISSYKANNTWQSTFYVASNNAFNSKCPNVIVTSLQVGDL